MTVEYSSPRRMWRSTEIAFLKALARINLKRPIDKPMAMTEFLDEVAHGRIKLSVQKPLRVHGKIN